MDFEDELENLIDEALPSGVPVEEIIAVLDRKAQSLRDEEEDYDVEED